jgi:murein DD-endopeptidase MepM/ murein hydrolase activator NlpD
VSAPEILDLVRSTDLAGIAEQLGKTRQLESERAALVYEAEKPQVMAPVSGTMTSNFGPRWGTTHYGLDIANAIGTPIVSATDGVVLESGPAAGFGLWVRIQQDDGTVGVYGHINEALVVAGQKVRAGELIATVGNRGQSTGPHLHYEVWQPDGQKTDPLAYLNSRGVSFGEMTTGD